MQILLDIFTFMCDSDLDGAMSFSEIEACNSDYPEVLKISPIDSDSFAAMDKDSDGIISNEELMEWAMDDLDMRTRAVSLSEPRGFFTD